MSAFAAPNQPMSITTRSAIAARAAAAQNKPARPTVASRTRAWFAARQRLTSFARLSSTARREFGDSAGLRQRSTAQPMRSGLDTFMR